MHEGNNQGISKSISCILFTSVYIILSLTILK
nr:MAG TPA: hypothetical protein [Caudoviricetes sp.]